MIELFDDIVRGADFSPDRCHRYSLWRIWNADKPLVMFIGLNPSTANHQDDDPTIKSVIRLAKFNGYGGVFMTNCYTYISTNPDELNITDIGQEDNYGTLLSIAEKCRDVVFAYGNFKQIEQSVKDRLCQMFPNALCIKKNKNGSPVHPLFQKGETRFIKF